MAAASRSTSEADTGAPDATAACPACRVPVAPAEVLCPACGSIQPVRALDHFARLGVARGFALAAADLDRAYFARQRQVHPDRFVGRPPAERDRSMQQTAALNEAYETLRQPLRRAAYLLRLAGAVDAATAASSESDPIILTEAMERREALAEAADAAAVAGLIAAAEAEFATAQAALVQRFAAADLAGASRDVTRLTYLSRFLDEAKGRHAVLGRA